VFCVNDRKAMQLVDKLTALDISIPDQLSVVGFDDAQFTEHPRIQLTTMRQPFQRIGYAAASMLLDLCLDSQQRFSHLLLGPQLVIRESAQRLEKTAPIL
jgi:DNA-binding LacI/PurR family transcriptional regulator